MAWANFRVADDTPRAAQHIGQLRRLSSKWTEVDDEM